MSNRIKVIVEFEYTPKEQFYPEGMSPVEMAKLDYLDPENFVLNTDYTFKTKAGIKVMVMDTITGEELEGTV